MRAAGLAAAVALGLAPACDASDMVREPEWTLSRMLDQPRVDPYAPSEFFADGRGMRAPVEGTVSREAVVGPPVLLDGFDDGGYAARVPMPVTRALLERGRDAFEVVCATCHGALGDGQSPVAAKMQLRRPPSLHDPAIARLPPGEVYRIVTVGYGLMPSAAPQLDVGQRWAVVAYLEALRLSQHARVAELPPRERAALARALP